MHEYAYWQTAALLRRLSKEAGKAARTRDADTVHNLRVAIRRMKGCLVLFADFYPESGRKKLKKKLNRLMHACGEVRDRDIALALLAEAGVPAGAAVAQRLAAERKDAARHLRSALQHWKNGRSSRQWRARLEM